MSAATSSARIIAGIVAIGPPRWMRLGRPTSGQHEVAGLAQLEEHQGRERRHRPLGEVDDPRAAVGEDRAHGDGRVDGAGAGADEAVEQPGRHGQVR